MASLVQKVARSLPLEPGERVVCAAMAAPDLATVRRETKRTQRVQGPLPAVMAGVAGGITVALRPDSLVDAMLFGGVAGMIGAAIGSSVTRRKARQAPPELANELAVVAVTDRRCMVAGRSALRSAWPDAWRSFPLDGATHVEPGERGKLGIVSAYTFTLSRAGHEPFTFALQRPKDTRAFRSALSVVVAPGRPDAA